MMWRCKAVRGRSPKVRWTAKEDAQVRAGATEVAGRTNNALAARRNTLGLPPRNPRTGRLWTMEEDKYVLANWGEMTSRAMGVELGRTATAVTQRLYKLAKKGIPWI